MAGVPSSSVLWRTFQRKSASGCSRPSCLSTSQGGRSHRGSLSSEWLHGVCCLAKGKLESRLESRLERKLECPCDGAVLCGCRYMKRRCAFLDNLPAFNYNSGYGEYQRNERGVMMPTDTRKLGSTLMETMLKEVSDFCDPAIKENWSLKPHQQVLLTSLTSFTVALISSCS